MRAKETLMLLGLVFLGVVLWLFVDGFVIGNTASQVKFLEIIFIVAGIGYGVYIAMSKFNQWLRKMERRVQTIAAEVRTTSQTVSADVSKNLNEAKQALALMVLILEVLASIFRSAPRPIGTYRK